MRLDQRLVELRLAESRSRAKALIEAGAVAVDGVAARKPSQTISDGAGNFAFTNMPAECTGFQLIRFDGMTATSPPGAWITVRMRAASAAVATAGGRFDP